MEAFDVIKNISPSLGVGGSYIDDDEYVLV